MLLPLPAGPIDLSAWDREWGRRHDVHELVEGVPTGSHRERIPNLRAVRELGGIIDAACLGRVEWFSGLEVHLKIGATPTVRRPDLVVIRRAPNNYDYRVRAKDVLLVAEVVSGSTVRTDRVDKAREYGQAGIPAYLVVDVRSAEPSLTLHTRPGVDGYRRVADSAPWVAIPIQGMVVCVHARDLIAL